MGDTIRDKWRRFWSGKKKIIGMLCAAAVQVYGMKQGWDAEVRNAVSAIFVGGVTLEGVLDGLAIIRGRNPNDGR